MSTLEIYRDDGPVGTLLGRSRLPGPALLVAAVALAAIAIGLSTPEPTVALPAFLAFIATGLWSRGAASHPKLGWLVPPILRVGEYGIVVWAAWHAIPGSSAVAYGLLAAVAFHHYDIVYRLRHQRVAPPTFVRLAGGGWEVRSAIVLAAVALDVTATAITVVAAWCGLLYVTESLASWLRVARDEQREVAQSLEDEEDIF